MSIPVTCQCGQRFAAPAALAGKTGKCPQCGQPLTVPGAQEPAPLGGLGDLLDEAGLSETPTGPVCPKCNTSLAEGAVLCVSCGYHLERGTSLQTKRVQEKRPVRSPVEQAMLAAGHEDFEKSIARLDRLRYVANADDRAMRGVRLVLKGTVMEAICLLFIIVSYVQAIITQSTVTIPLPSESQPGTLVTWMVGLVGILLFAGGIYRLVGVIYCIMGSGPSGGRPYLIVFLALEILAGLLYAPSLRWDLALLMEVLELGAGVAWMLFLWKFSKYLNLQITAIIALVFAAGFTFVQVMGGVAYAIMPPGSGAVLEGAVVISKELAARNFVAKMSQFIPASCSIWLLWRILTGR